MRSLASRLLLALLIPLLLLVSIAAAITCWVVYHEEEVTADRVLIGSARTLSLAFDSPQQVRPALLRLALDLLKRRARPNPYYSVYDGERLVAGYSELTPPADYALYSKPPFAHHSAARHRPAEFSDRYAPTLLHKGYVEPDHARTVVQAAYLRDGTFRDHPARIATEIRQVAGFARPLAIQVANPIDARRAWQLGTYYRVIGGAGAIFVVAGLFFWWAVLWGLRPFHGLTEQVDGQRATANFRLSLPANAPREAEPFVAAFNALLARTEKATASVRQFTADASHQMRTPLAVLRTHVHVLKRSCPVSQETSAAIEDTVAAVATLERLLIQLIALARAEEQELDQVSQSFDLVDAVAHVARECTPEALKADHEIDFESFAPGGLQVYGNGLLAGELTRNLLENAIRYSPRASHIKLRVLARNGEEASLEVEDDGPGIPEADRRKVFERFYRLARDSDRAGSGLGLPIVRALADRMGARVELATGADGSGLRAIATFRRVPAAALRAAPVSATA
jgi:two-component system sensor histidine kinase TctE